MRQIQRWKRTDQKKRRIKAAAMIIMFTLIFCLAPGVFSGEASAAQIIESGSFNGPVGGSVFTWTLDSSGQLTISGTGRMPYWGPDDEDVYYPPWYELRREIKTAVIEQGAENIETWAFYGCDVRWIVIPVSVKRISADAFENCSELKDVYYEGKEEEWQTINIESYGNGYLLNAVMHYGAVQDQVKGLQALPFGNKIRIGWDAVEGADGYRIYATYADGSKYKTYDTAKLYCSFTRLTNGKTYGFKVRAYMNGSSGGRTYCPYSDTVRAKPYDDLVKNLTAEAFDQRILLTWDAVEGASGYNIYAMFADGSKYKAYNTGKPSKLHCNFTGLNNGNKYQFKVREYKLDAKGTKIFADDYCTPVAATPRRDAVNGMILRAFDRKVNVSWEPAENADGYYIDVKYGDGTSYKTYSTAKTYCNFTNLINGKEYKFRVRAYDLNSKGEKVYGKYCDSETAVPYDDTVKNPTAEGGPNRIRLSWDPVEGAEGYNIYAMYSDGSKYKTYNTVKTTCNFNNLITGNTYGFRIREYKLNAAGGKVYGSYSETVCAAAE